MSRSASAATPDAGAGPGVEVPVGAVELGDKAPVVTRANSLAPASNPKARRTAMPELTASHCVTRDRRHMSLGVGAVVVVGASDVPPVGCVVVPIRCATPEDAAAS